MKNFEALIKYADSALEKKAALEKRADPPHAGLNDPNPLKRELYKRYGYTAPAPASYFGQTDPSYLKHFYNDLKEQSEFSKKWNSDNIDFIRDNEYDSSDDEDDFGSIDDAMRNSMARKLMENNAATYDYLRSIGAIPTQYNQRYVSPDMDRETSNAVGSMISPRMEVEHTGRPFVTIGSWPMSADKIVRHELGHADDENDYYTRHLWKTEGDEDPKKYTSWEFSRQPIMQRETIAWDKSGVPASDPLRRAMLDTYWPADKLMEWGIPSPDAYRDLLIGGNRIAAGRAMDMARMQYERPEVLAERYKDHGVPFVYDYNTALENMADLPFIGDDDANFDRRINLPKGVNIRDVNSGEADRTWRRKEDALVRSANDELRGDPEAYRQVPMVYRRSSIPFVPNFIHDRLPSDVRRNMHDVYDNYFSD